MSLRSELHNLETTVSEHIDFAIEEADSEEREGLEEAANALELACEELGKMLAKVDNLVLGFRS